MLKSYAIFGFQKEAESESERYVDRQTTDCTQKCRRFLVVISVKRADEISCYQDRVTYG